MRNKPVNTDSQPVKKSGGLLHQVSHLETSSFIRVLQQADFVISRSGYSSIMDFIALDISCNPCPLAGSKRTGIPGQLAFRKRMVQMREPG